MFFSEQQIAVNPVLRWCIQRSQTFLREFLITIRGCIQFVNESFSRYSRVSLLLCIVLFFVTQYQFGRPIWRNNLNKRLTFFSFSFPSFPHHSNSVMYSSHLPKGTRGLWFVGEKYVFFFGNSFSNLLPLKMFTTCASFSAYILRIRVNFFFILKIALNGSRFTENIQRHFVCPNLGLLDFYWLEPWPIKYVPTRFIGSQLWSVLFQVLMFSLPSATLLTLVFSFRNERT